MPPLLSPLTILGSLSSAWEISRVVWSGEHQCICDVGDSKVRDPQCSLSVIFSLPTNVADIKHRFRVHIVLFALLMYVGIFTCINCISELFSVALTSLHPVLQYLLCLVF